MDVKCTDTELNKRLKNSINQALSSRKNIIILKIIKRRR